MGGIAEFPDLAGPIADDSATYSDSSSASEKTALGIGLAVLALAAIAGAWYAGRRWIA